MPSLELQIKPELLVWARESLNETIESIASYLKVPVSLVRDWEQGNHTIRLRQLEKLSRHYKRPLAVFFLPNPPSTDKLPEDFRSLDGVPAQNLSPETLLVIRRAERELAIAESLGAEKPNLKFVANQADEPNALAQSLRQELGVTMEVQGSWRKPSVAVKMMRRAIEGRNIIVMQGGMPKEEARAFSITHNGISGIVLNSRDEDSAKLFSLLHELCHLLLRMPGICIPTYSRSRGVEAFCNEFAANFLVPESDLLMHHSVRNHKSVEWDDLELRKLSIDFGVSSEVILRRLLTLQRTTKEFYTSRRREWKAAYASVAKQKKGGPVSPAQKALGLYGESFVTLVLSSYERNQITGADVTDYLGLKIGHLKELQTRLNP